MLERVTVRSPSCVNELQILEERQVADLLAEFRRLRRICRREEFMQGMDAERAFDHWRTWSIDGKMHGPEEMNGYLDKIEDVLGRAVEYHWTVHLES